ncbi:hypothetical protein C9374_013519 [Naegleria lovaniensis]|uniref:Chromo domain-containing protein n=1 Tax=Naegleria lovaniensis TaxID=51637 RepID=A0AA88KQR4_NAELO|nr:uncharacterized protein C9374_013519 [Naegleria lovaniensis]KAG2392034.1 hypothetical protein C9374_013519 [Naegleria lovaniensis]
MKQTYELSSDEDVENDSTAAASDSKRNGSERNLDDHQAKRSSTDWKSTSPSIHHDDKSSPEIYDSSPRLVDASSRASSAMTMDQFLQFYNQLLINVFFTEQGFASLPPGLQVVFDHFTEKSHHPLSMEKVAAFEGEQPKSSQTSSPRKSLTSQNTDITTPKQVHKQHVVTSSKSSPKMVTPTASPSKSAVSLTEKSTVSPLNKTSSSEKASTSRPSSNDTNDKKRKKTSTSTPRTTKRKKIQKRTPKQSKQSVDGEELGEDEYFVKAILDHKIENGKKKYLIHWKGYPKSESTWEPAENIHADLITDYENKLKAKKKR